MEGSNLSCVAFVIREVKVIWQGLLLAREPVERKKNRNQLIAYSGNSANLTLLVPQRPSYYYSNLSFESKLYMQSIPSNLFLDSKTNN